MYWYLMIIHYDHHMSTLDTETYCPVCDFHVVIYYQNIIYLPFFGFDICHLLHFTHVICNYRHIFTVLVNFMACKSQIFFSFCWSWSPALWSHPFNKDENRWPLRWIWCSSYSVGSQYIGIDMENRNAQGTPLNDLNIQLQQVINALMW